MAKKYLVPIDMNGLEIQNFKAHNLATAPTGSDGKVYFNTADKKLYYYNGTSWVALTANTNVAKTTTTPKMDGTAAIGSETKYAAGDHVHPTDTSRAPLASPALTGTPTAPTASAGTNTTQIATTAFVKAAVDALDTGVSDVQIGGTSVVASGVANLTNGEFGQCYAECNTPANTYAKVINNTSFSLKTGGILAVRFTDDAKYLRTLNVNGTGAKYVNYKGTAATSSTTINTSIQAGYVAYFMYSGSQYMLLNWQHANATENTGGYMSSDDKSKLNGIASGAEVNQNAFSNVTIGSTTIAADGKTDTLTLVAGSNVTLTPDATNDKVTIAATDTTYGAGTQALLEAGTDTENRVWQPKILHDYVAAAAGAVDAMRFKGTIGTGGDVTTLPTSGVKVGDTYRVITAGTYAGQTCEIGDLIIATATTPTWTVAQTNIDGAITSISGTAPISVSGSGSSRTIAISAASGSAAGSMSSTHYTKLEGIASGAEVNQNAFSNVKVGNTTVAADTKTDTLELAGTAPITLTPDSTNDKVTFSISAASGSAAGSMSSAHYTKLEGIASGAEVNQNAFSNIKVGSTTVAADSKTDTLELVAGSNVTLTPDATNDKVTIAASHPTYTAFTGKPTANATPGFGGTVTISQISQSTSGQVSGTDRTIKIPNTTATTSAAGLMSASDKIQLNNLSGASGFWATYEVLEAGQTSKSIDCSDFDIGSDPDVISFTAIDLTNQVPVVIDWSVNPTNDTITCSIASAVTFDIGIRVVLLPTA